MDEQEKLLNHLDSIYTEGDSVRQKNLKKYESYIQSYRGEIWKGNVNKPRVRLVANHLKEIIVRKTALMTDVSPQIEIVPNSDMEEMYHSAKILKGAIESLYEQNSWSMAHEEIIYFNQLCGYVFTNVGWDKTLEWGEGDISIREDNLLRVLRPELGCRLHVFVDYIFTLIKFMRPCNIGVNDIRPRVAGKQADIAFPPFKGFIPTNIRKYIPAELIEIDYLLMCHRP